MGGNWYGEEMGTYGEEGGEGEGGEGEVGEGREWEEEEERWVKGDVWDDERGGSGSKRHMGDWMRVLNVKKKKKEEKEERRKKCLFI